jgi:ribosomal protein S18 acetylase RimI-like enzyme
MDAWQRAIAFLRDVDARCAEVIEDYPWGRALINRRLHLVHDLNYLIADHVDGVGASELVAEAERIQGAAGLWHRRVNVDDQPAADRLSPNFAALGYQPERFVVMALQRPPNRASGTAGVMEVDWEMMRPARESAVRRRPWAIKPQLVDQILGKHQLTASRIGTRYFAALADGRVVSSCELRSEGETAQVETVETFEEFRGRGLARAVVSAALDAASTGRFIFLVADANDWPQRFYQRLGFDTVGVESRFLRLLDSPAPSAVD